jgi:hypothetical protein
MDKFDIYRLRLLRLGGEAESSTATLPVVSEGLVVNTRLEDDRCAICHQGLELV